MSSGKKALMDILARRMSGGDDEDGIFELNLGGSGKTVKQNWDVTISPEAQIMTLREQLNDYVDPQFKVGDIVTVKGFSTTRGLGVPALVVETRYGQDREPVGERAASAQDGRVLNIRIMTHVENELITCFWDEAWNFELWDDRKHGSRKN